MATLRQVRAVWSVPKGGAGVSTFHADESVPNPLARVKAFFEALKTTIPNAALISYPSTGPLIDDSDGATVGVWTETGVANTSLTGAGGYAGQAGCCIVWHTGFYVNRRELKGRTFIVPIVSAMYDGDGTFLPGALTIFNTAAALLTTGTNPLSVYSPTNHVSKPMVSSNITDRSMTLKSRSM
jgi:hypothetical protein